MIVLLALGLGLIIIEIIFVPGTTVVGILGFAGMIFGIYLGYAYFGNNTGHALLAISALVSFLSMFWVFKTGAWERFSLKKTSKSKFNEGQNNSLKIGDEGISLSTLKPVGKAEFNFEEFEVSSIGDYIDEREKIKIIRKEGNKIYVEKL